MAGIVPSIHPSTIGAVIEANINAYRLSFAGLPGAALSQDPRCVWIDAGIADTTFNAVVSARFDPDSVDEGIETVLAHFRGRSLPFSWHVGPRTEPADLGRHLLAHGLTHTEEEPGMALELDRARDDFAIPPGLVIEPVLNEHDLREWVDVWLFPVPDDIRELYFEALRLRGLGEDLPWRYYLGRLGGKPVATSELFVAAGVAAVHYVVAMPEVRRRGVGTAMTQQVVREARARGYKIVVLTASPDGIGIYRQMGFQEYCWFRRYEWDPPDVDNTYAS